MRLSRERNVKTVHTDTLASHLTTRIGPIFHSALSKIYITQKVNAMNRNDFNILRDKFAMVDQIHDILTAVASSSSSIITIACQPKNSCNSHCDYSQGGCRTFTLTPALTTQVISTLQDMKNATEKELEAIILSAKDNPELEPSPAPEVPEVTGGPEE